MNLGLLTLVVVYCVLFNQKVDSKKTVNRGSQRSIFNRIISERIRAKRAVWNLNSFRNPEELGDYVEGDIIQTISGGLGRSSSQIALWPGGTIPYVISGDFNYQQLNLIEQAINDFNTYTCLRFTPRNNQLAYVDIRSNYGGCYSTVGYTGQAQGVNLQIPICLTTKGTVIHELMHAAGFSHEHTRYDRDQYIDIQWENILFGQQGNFHKSENNAETLSTAYDYSSVMHYTNTAFSANGLPTIVARNNVGITLGQRDGFSEGDITKIERMYQCGSLPRGERRQIPMRNAQKNIIDNSGMRKKCFLNMCWDEKAPIIMPKQTARIITVPQCGLLDLGCWGQRLTNIF